MGPRLGKRQMTRDADAYPALYNTASPDFIITYPTNNTVLP